MSNYLKQINNECDPFIKGFVALLVDNKFLLEKYSDVIRKNHSTVDVEQLFNKYKSDEIQEKKQKYFLKHLNIYFKINEKYTLKDKMINIISGLMAYSNDPINYLISVLNRGTFNNSEIKEILKFISSTKFIILLENQLKILNKNTNVYFKNFKLNKELFSEKQYKIFHSLSNSFSDNSEKYNFNIVLKEINIIYNEYLKNNNPIPNIDVNIDFIDKANDNDKKNNVIDKIINKENKPISNNEFINSLFNPVDSYISTTYEKYKELSSRLTYDSKDCRVIKSILYVLTYVMKDKDFDAAKYMKNILKSDIGWAVGDENNKKPSFYGNSDLAKFFYGYYSYMNGDENPYTEIIDNRIVKKMDYNAIMINNYFKNNGLKNVGFSDENIKEIYSLLVNFRHLVKIIDAPISIDGTADNFIQGIISGIMNSAATMIDFSVSSVARSLFYAEIIPINDKRYSLAQVYNYTNFIKLVLESAGENKEGKIIDKEEFINHAYSVLGINENSIMKIGYCAYDRDLNVAVGLNMYSDEFYKNKNDMQFTVKSDLKLLYSLIQFGIQKKSVLTGDLNFEKKFVYGNEYAVRNILDYLTDTEIYYIFNLYLINPWTLDDELGNLSKDEVYDFNKKLLNIENLHNHHKNSFYNLYLDKDPNKIYKSMISYDFLNTNYKKLINIMFSQYRKALKYNKKKLESIIFSSNDITDIDDFLVRFLPSIIELLKLFGVTEVNFKSIISFLDYLLILISDTLFRNLFINVKVALSEFVKRYTDKLLSPIKKFNIGGEEGLKIDFNFGESKFVQMIDLIIDMIEKGNFNLFSIQSCFNKTYVGSSSDDPMIEDDLVFNGGHNSISRNEFFDKTQNSLDKSYHGANSDVVITYYPKDKTQKEKKYQEIKDKIKVHRPTDNKKIYYDKGNIFIEKTDGTKEIIVSKNDKVDIEYIYKEFPETTDKNLSENEYEQLIEIRDYINNIINKEIMFLNKKLTIEKNNLKIEYSKKIPNYNNIKKINKNIEELTSIINDVKKENRIIQSESDDKIIIAEFDNSNSSQNNYSTLSDFFKKKEVLKEVNEIVYDNNVTLTNYQITQLLK